VEKQKQPKRVSKNQKKQRAIAGRKKGKGADHELRLENLPEPGGRGTKKKKKNLVDANLGGEGERERKTGATILSCIEEKVQWRGPHRLHSCRFRLSQG